MRVVDPPRLRSSINVTPLVDVVLVLLIIFMVIAPRLEAGPGIDVPTTADPAEQSEPDRIVVAIDDGGRVWIGDHPTSAERFAADLRFAASDAGNRRVVIEADGALTFGEVREAMLAIDRAGFADVGLIARRRDASVANPAGSGG